MKKLLSIIGAVGLTATASTAVISCGYNVKLPSDNDPYYHGEIILKNVGVMEDGKMTFVFFKFNSKDIEFIGLVDSTGQNQLYARVHLNKIDEYYKTKYFYITREQYFKFKRVERIWYLRGEK